MENYKVIVEVEYLVSADSMNEAIEKITNDTEFPVIGGGEYAYAIKDTIVSITKTKGEVSA